MSHFVVMVTNVNEESLEEQLEPFYEQGEEYDYFMEKEYYLLDNEKEIDDYVNREIEGIKEQIQSQKKRIDETKGEEQKGAKNHLKWLEKELKELDKIKLLKNTKRRLTAIRNFEGGNQDDKGLYWIYNPNAKWDWWVEGGRWDGWLVKKNGERCNRCLVKELDFEGMRKAELEDRAKYYDEEIKKPEPFFWGYKQTPTRDEYVYGAEISISPYAVLHDGEWIEKGEMGWFGIDDPHYTEEEWDKKFQEFIKNLNPETEIAVVDCHI